METRITATELASNLSDILNRVRYKGESFQVERNGEVVAEIKPARKRMTAAEFADWWKTIPKPDDDYWKDLQEIHDSQGVLPSPPEWPS